MRSRRLNAVVVMLVALLGVSCASEQTCVHHIVVCWLKSPGDERARQQLIDESRALGRAIPGILRVHAGAPIASDRPQVEGGYDVAIIMTFRDEAALRAYEQHPRHRQAVEQVLKPLVAKAVIYDFAEAP